MQELLRKVLLVSSDFLCLFRMFMFMFIHFPQSLCFNPAVVDIVDISMEANTVEFLLDLRAA